MAITQDDMFDGSTAPEDTGLIQGDPIRDVNGNVRGPYNAATGSYNPGGGEWGYDDLKWGHVVHPSAYWYGADPLAAGREQQRYAGMAGQADNRQGAQIAASPYGAQYKVDRNIQGYGLNAYRAMIEGNGPSVAQLQMYRGLQGAQQGAASLAASARGGGAQLAAAQRMAAMQHGQLAAQTNEQSGMLRASEQQQAMAGYAQMANARLGQSGQMATSQAQLQQQQNALNDARNAQYEQMRQRVAEDQAQYGQAGEAANAGAYFNTQQVRQGDEQNSSNTRNAVISGSLAAGAALLAASDVRVKKDIQPAGAQVDQAMDAMGPYDYRYKQPEKYGRGEQVGPMAQELAATPAGRTAVTKMPDGKLAIDLGQGTKLSLAGIARLNERVRQLEASSPVAAPVAHDLATGGVPAMMSGAYRANPEVVHEAGRDMASMAAPYMAGRLAHTAADAPHDKPRLRDYVAGGLPGMVAGSYLRGGR